MKFKNFLDLFPPPQFLDVPYAGLSISDNAIRCIKFNRHENGVLYVQKWYEREIPPDLVVSGSIDNPKEITRLLTDVAKEFGNCFFKVSLPEEKAYLFTTKLGLIAPEKIRETIEFTIEDNVPLPAADLTFDYAIADRHGHGDHVNVIVSALPTSIVDGYAQTVQGANISVLSLEIESQAMARALVPVDSTDTRLIIHFGKQKVGLYVVYKRIVHFTSTISIKSELHDDVGALSKEIEKLYTYWHTLKENIGQPDKQISQIIMCGEDIQETVPAYLSQNHHTPAVVGNVWQNAFAISENIPPVPFVDSLRFSAAVGLALPDEILI